MTSVKTEVMIKRSAFAELGSRLGAFADWFEEHKWRIAAVAAFFVLGFLGKLTYDNLPLMSSPVEAVSPTTIVETHEGSTTIITQVIQAPAQPTVSRPAEKKEAAVVVLTTEASSAPTQVSSPAASLPSMSPSKSASEDTSAPTTSELPTVTTSASSAPTTNAVPPASTSDTP